jgi:hypothetical protein
MSYRVIVCTIDIVCDLDMWMRSLVMSDSTVLGPLGSYIRPMWESITALARLASDEEDVSMHVLDGNV